MRPLALSLVLALFLPLFVFSQKIERVEILNLPYNLAAPTDTLQQLNLVLPKANCNCPLLIWVGGGAWSYVNRAMEMNLARNFAKDGIAVAAVGHRLSSAVWQNPALKTGVQHPLHVQDVAKAVKWLVVNAEKYGYSRRNIFLGGYSSGAHLVSLLSLDSTYLRAEGLSVSDLKGVIPIAGAYDIQNYYEVFKNSKTSSAMADTHVKAVFGQTEEDFRKASPTSYVQFMKLPMLLISENNTYAYTRIFEDKIRETDFRNFESLHIHKLGHGPLWKNLSLDENSPYKKRIIAFILENETL